MVEPAVDTLSVVDVTDAQLRVLGALLRFHADTDAAGAPTLDELAWLAGRSRSTVYEHLGAGAARHAAGARGASERVQLT